MTQAAEALPDDPETLKAMLIAERERAERLVQIIKDLQRHRFGRRAESLPEDQLLLALEDVEQGEAEAEAKSSAGRAKGARRRRANRGAAHLPRIETLVDVADQDLSVLQGRVAPDRRGRQRTARRHSRAVPGAGGAPAQVRLPSLRERGRPAARAGAADRGRPADRGDGRPRPRLQIRRPSAAYRQAKIYERQGLRLDRSTLADWVGRAAFHLRPVHERILAHLKSSTKLFADETTAPVLDPGRGRTKTGQLWAYARDDRPWGGTDPPAVAYVYAPDRTASQPIAHLAGFKGVLQVDGYAGYRALASKGDVTLAFCWAHLRRRFYERAVAEASPIANEALQRIAALYRIEAGCEPDARRAVRHECSRPIVAELEPWLRERLPLLSRKSKLAQAIRYGLSHWDGLNRFLDDGRIEIDSNTVERSIRPLALTRKNALFAGSDGGAESWAIVASLIETCKLNDVDPNAYLTDTLTRIVDGHLVSAIEELLPWAYAKVPPLKDAA